MIDSTFLDVKEGSEWWLKLESKLENVWIYGEDDEQIIHIGVNLHPNEKGQLVHLMKQYKEIFAWSLTNMLGINISVAYHKLSIDPGIKPIY